MRDGRAKNVAAPEANLPPLDSQKQSDKNKCTHIVLLLILPFRS